MPTQLLETTFIARVRRYMRDYPAVNRLIAGEETKDSMISLAIAEAASFWNAYPPIGVSTISITVSGETVDEDGEIVEVKQINIPPEVEHLLLTGTIIEILKKP